ncbi:MAG: undecaprenyl-diphosphate phosphatase [Planctomycetota bacterium]|nr:undecaprenyl-diphosphate phosphatase [Planctomycetota bacterium]
MPELWPDFAALSLLALIQGLTEFLPISSSGHLVLTREAIGLDRPALVLDVALHLGTLLAVLVVYRRDIAGLVADLRAGRPREILLLVLGTLPAAAVGLGLRDLVAETFHDGRIAALGLLGTGALLVVGEAARRRRAAKGGREVGWGIALGMGLAQAVAILPGISRSGATIAVGMLCGLEPARAARFSFLLSIPAILGAALVELPGAGGEGLGGGGVASLVWAALFAGFVGWGALRMLLAFLGRGAFGWFAVYCVALGGGYLLFA